VQVNNTTTTMATATRSIHLKYTFKWKITASHFMFPPFKWKITTSHFTFPPTYQKY